MHIPNGTKLVFSLLFAVVLSFNNLFLSLAQEPTPTLTPTSAPQTGTALPGDTTILVIGAVILVLIVLGGVLKQSRLSK